MLNIKYEDSKNIFYISDLHFGHKNIIKHCNRPFETVEEMDKTLIQNWNSAVTNKDIVYVVGDFSYATKNDYLPKLNGEIHLVRGNHDKKVEGFKSVEDIVKIKHRDRQIVLCHYPMVEWDGYYKGVLHFFGHIHNNVNLAQNIMRDIPNAYNVGADLLGFTPRTAEEIINWGV